MTAKKNRRRHALADHEQRGKTFIPPFISGLGGYSSVEGFTWHDDVLPEIVWLALLYRAEPRQAGERARAVLAAAKDAYRGEGGARFCLTTPWADFGPAECNAVRAALEREEVFDAVASAVAPLVWLYPECPLAAVFRRPADEPTDEATYHEYGRRLFEAVQALLIRRTRETVLVEGIAVYAAVLSGAISPHGLEPEDLPSLMDYPETERSREAASFVHMRTCAFARIAARESSWRRYFWRRGALLGPCLPAQDRWHAGVRDSMETAEKLTSLFEKLSTAVEEEFAAAWNAMPVDLAAPQQSEVVGGLLARQVRYVRHLVTHHPLFLDELGQLVLRSMVESAITLAWLIRKGQPADYDRFVQYGLGQEKLALDHLGATKETSVFLERRRQQELTVRQEWLESQKRSQLLEVDVSIHWAAPKKIRELAEEADMIDLYTTVYTPTSAYVHGSWNAVGRTALRYCLHPQHRLHMIPDVTTTRVDLTTVITAIRVLQRSWDAVREWATDVPASICLPETLEQIGATLDAKLGDQPASEENADRKEERC